MNSETVVNDAVHAICDADNTLTNLDGILNEETCRRLRACVEKVKALYNFGILEIKPTGSSSEVIVKREKGYGRAEPGHMISLLHALCGSCGLKDKQNNKKSVCVYASAQDVQGPIRIDHDKAIRTSNECWVAWQATVSEAMEKKASGKKGGTVVRGSEKDAAEKSVTNDKAIKNAMTKQKFDLSTTVPREVLMFQVRILTQVSDALMRPQTNAQPESEDDDEMDVDETVPAPIQNETTQSNLPERPTSDEVEPRTFDMIHYPSDASGDKWTPLCLSLSQTILHRSFLAFSVPRGGQRHADYDPRLMSVPANVRESHSDFARYVNLPMEQHYSLQTLHHLRNLHWHGLSSHINNLSPAASVTVPVGIITPKATMDGMKLAAICALHQSDNCAAVDIIEDAVASVVRQHAALVDRSRMWLGQHQPIGEKCVELFRKCLSSVVPNFKFRPDTQFIGTEMIGRRGFGYDGRESMFGDLTDEATEDFKIFLVNFATTPSPNRLNSYTLAIIRSYICRRNGTGHADVEKWKKARFDTTRAIMEALEMFIQACTCIVDLGTRGMEHNSAGLDHLLLYSKSNLVRENLEGKEIDAVTKELVNLMKNQEKRLEDVPIYPSFIGFRHIRPKRVPHAHPFTSPRSSSIYQSKAPVQCEKEDTKGCPKCTGTGHLPIPHLTYLAPEVLEFFNSKNLSETFTFEEDAASAFSLGLSIIDIFSSMIGMPRDPESIALTPTTNVHQKISDRKFFLKNIYNSTLDDAMNAVSEAIAEQKEERKFYSKGDLDSLMPTLFKDAGSPEGTYWRYNFKDAIEARKIMTKVRQSTEITDSKLVKLNSIPERYVNEVTSTSYVSFARGLNAMLDCVEPLRQASAMFDDHAPMDQTATTFFKEFRTDNQRFLNPACLVHIALTLEDIDMDAEISQHFKKGFHDLAETLTSLQSNLLLLLKLTNKCCDPDPRFRPNVFTLRAELIAIRNSIDAIEKRP